MGFFPYSTQNRQIKVLPTAHAFLEQIAEYSTANNSTYTVTEKGS